MPRYTQVTPTFTPVDYATRIAPLEEYKDEYDKRLDKIEEQGLLADAIGGLIDENTDPELMQVYNDYSTKMQNTAKNLLDSGDLRSSRQSLLELRRDYANKLLPIQQAFNNRADAAKSFREQKAKDPTYIGTDPLSHGLKDYMNGKSPDDKSVSGAQLYAMGQSDAKAASSRRILRDKWGLDSSLGNQYFSRMIREGWSQKEIEDALYKLSNGEATEADLKDASGAVRYLQEASNRIASAYKVGDFNDDEKIAQSQAFIMNGLLSGMTYSEDDDTKSYDPAFWDKAEKEKLELKKAKGEFTQDNPELSYSITPLININGKLIRKDDAAETLSWFKSGNTNLDAFSTKRIEDNDSVPKDEKGNPLPYINSYKTYKKKTYGEDLYELAKSQGVIDKNLSYNEFKNDINSNKLTINGIIDNLESKIIQNAQMYGEARGNITDTKYFAKNINDANTTFINDKGKVGNDSLIKDGKGNPVASIPEEDVEYVLPVRASQRKGIRVKSNKDGSVYYINPSAFYGSAVVIPTTGGGYATIPLSDAINYYYIAIDNGDNETAHYLRGEIMDQLAVYTRNRVKTQSSTDSKI